MTLLRQLARCTHVECQQRRGNQPAEQALVYRVLQASEGQREAGKDCGTHPKLLSWQCNSHFLLGELIECSINWSKYRLIGLLCQMCLFISLQTQRSQRSQHSCHFKRSDHQENRLATFVTISLRFLGTTHQPLPRPNCALQGNQPSERALVFSLFSGERWQARSERGARDSRASCFVGPKSAKSSTC